jgi:hypothetical protein
MGMINKIPDVRRPQQKNLALPARAEKEVIRYALFVLAAGAHVIPASIKEA